MKISIITIVYNNRNHIADCIKSVMSQNYTDVEYILIDGGSTDGTQQEIEPFVHKLAYYVSEKDDGLYNALNKGIKRATGDVIGILHSDDLFFEKNTLSKIAEIFETTDTHLVYANGQYVDRQNINKVKRIYPARKFKKCCLKFGWIPLHTTIYVKREVFEKYGLYDENYSIASDYDISLRWFLNDEIKKVFLNEWVVKMRLGGKSTNIQQQRKKSVEDMMIIKKYSLLGYFTLFCKIAQKVPQYVLPVFFKY